jgi:hypothetical protein
MLSMSASVRAASISNDALGPSSWRYYEGTCGSPARGESEKGQMTTAPV